ncbi:hypothetical protein [Rhodococcus oxybenzonivorans]|uniref:hypothetical protein n=1 Tax=Rhodococcus oxybenzonivorans TaxID=1990687 RepID=UPI0019512C45|nr:hypothetical protein [Rhodococcus oxybenzonivorans]
MAQTLGHMASGTVDAPDRGNTAAGHIAELRCRRERANGFIQSSSRSRLCRTE